ncbi:Hypothetical predicted protein [Lynx pardinus]|uniref:Immunoglobulin domain-containing protein n=1 Tax=Lynx pardinus TaxID=191816 RepID=A0A485N0D1_LYNPA|nr:Hypothetical predicted protein [Lynx pardinus]
MDLWLWSLCFLPVAGALRNLPEVKLEGILGSSITIECPLPQKHVRLYLCREVAESGVCSTVVSSKNFVKEEYKHRVTLKPYPDQNVFLVEVTELTKSDSGVYACGTGVNTDRGKTQQVTLSVHSEYDPFWEDELMPEPPRWLHKFLQRPMPPWFQMPAHADSLEFIPKATPPAQRTEAPPATHPSPTTQISHHLQVSRASSVAVTKPPTFLPSTTTTSKTSTPGVLRRLQTASYNYHSRLHRQRFHTSLPVISHWALLSHVATPVFKGDREIESLIEQLCALLRRDSDTQQQATALPQLPLASCPCPCPYPLLEKVHSSLGMIQQHPSSLTLALFLELPCGHTHPHLGLYFAQIVMETVWLHAPSLKTSCEYVSLYYKPVAKAEDTDSDDYVNIPCLTHLSHCPPGPKPWCH